METRILTVPDISCDHCKATIEREVGSLDGVQKCSVNVPAKRVTVVYDEGRVRQDDIVNFLDDVGYPTTGAGSAPHHTPGT